MVVQRSFSKLKSSYLLNLARSMSLSFRSAEITSALSSSSDWRLCLYLMADSRFRIRLSLLTCSVDKPLILVCPSEGLLTAESELLLKGGFEAARRVCFCIRNCSIFATRILRLSAGVCPMVIAANIWDEIEATTQSTQILICVLLHGTKSDLLCERFLHAFVAQRTWAVTQWLPRVRARARGGPVGCRNFCGNKGLLRWCCWWDRQHGAAVLDGSRL